MEKSVISFEAITRMHIKIIHVHSVCCTEVMFKLFFLLKGNDWPAFCTGECNLDMFIGKADTAAGALIKRFPNYINRQ